MTLWSVRRTRCYSRVRNQAAALRARRDPTVTAIRVWRPGGQMTTWYRRSGWVREDYRRTRYSAPRDAACHEQGWARRVERACTLRGWLVIRRLELQ